MSSGHSVVDVCDLCPLLCMCVCDELLPENVKCDFFFFFSPDLYSFSLLVLSAC